MRAQKIIVTFSHYDYDSYSRFMDAMFSCGSPNVDWTVTSIDHAGDVRRYEVHTRSVETLRDICANQGLGMREEI